MRAKKFITTSLKLFYLFFIIFFFIFYFKLHRYGLPYFVNGDENSGMKNLLYFYGFFSYANQNMVETFSYGFLNFLSTGLLDINYLEPRNGINLERLSLFLNIANYWDSFGFTGVGFGLSYEGFLSAIKTNLNYLKHREMLSIPSIFIS